MSPHTHDTRPPRAAAASASTSSRRPAITTEAPQATSSAAAWRPRFVPPPVTSATRPASRSDRKMDDSGTPWDPIRVSRTLAERLAARDAGRFVGRGREVGRLDLLLVDEPPAQVVLLHGAGVTGKSTLLREVARRGGARGWPPRLVDG